jgi:hypothetical protein
MDGFADNGVENGARAVLSTALAEREVMCVKGSTLFQGIIFVHFGGTNFELEAKISFSTMV